MTVRVMDADTSRATLAPQRLREGGFEDAVAALASDDSAVRAEAAFALGMQAKATAAAALEDALKDDEARVRVEAALALARLGDETAAGQALRAELKGDFFADAPLRAARGLALLGDASGYARVVDALQSELPSNRMEAVAVLPAFAELRRDDVIGALRGALSDAEPVIRGDAEAALRALGEGVAQ